MIPAPVAAARSIKNAAAAKRHQGEHFLSTQVFPKMKGLTIKAVLFVVNRHLLDYKV